MHVCMLYLNVMYVYMYLCVYTCMPYMYYVYMYVCTMYV